MQQTQQLHRKQVVFIHGGEAFDTREAYLEYLREQTAENPFGSEDSSGWKHGLQEALGEEYAVAHLSMPCPKNAKYDEWKLWFNKYVPFFEDGIIFIGHSLGANFLAKCLGECTLPAKAAQLYLVAGCFGTEGGFRINGELLCVEAQVEEVYIYHSQDDEVVSYEHAQRYKKAIPKAKLRTFKDRGHFLGEEFPELVKNIRTR